MKSTPVPLGTILEIRIESIASNGKGKGSAVLPGMEKVSFFIDGAAPGDRILAKVTAGHKRYVEADLIEIIESSTDRIEPVCPHFSNCGGCQLQHIHYERQLSEKQEILHYVLRRSGINVEVKSLIPSPQPYRYRVRSTISVDEQGRPSLLKRASHDLISIESCVQMERALEEALLSCAEYFFRHERNRRESLKIRGVLDTSTQAVWVHPYTRVHDADSPDDWFRIVDGEVSEKEKAECSYQVDDFFYHYAPDCFTQVNPHINQLLVRYAVEQLELMEKDQVLELYSGIGNFTLPIAKQSANVMAIEWPRAAVYAKQNAKANGLGNIKHMEGDVQTLLNRLAHEKTKINALLLDPPREGLGTSGCSAIASLNPSRVVYISCDPSTLVTDLKVLIGLGYSVINVQPFDMFPQTNHLETCVSLRRMAIFS